MSAQSPRLLIVSQVYVPDPASVGQHLHDVARGMAARGFEVEVLTSEAGYDDPTQRYPREEMLDGVRVQRLPWSSFGKGSIAARLAAGASFLAQALTRALRGAAPDALLISTSPPIAPAFGALFKRLRGVRLVYWVMDINPDQLVALGQIGAHSPAVRVFDAINAEILGAADRVVALDAYMAERLRAKRDPGERLSIVPPWPHTSPPAAPLPRLPNAFRERHRLGEDFVVMYSGNLSPCHPVDTVLEAARVLRDEPVRFVFVGGGNGRADIERFADRHALPNVALHDYVPLEELEASLSAADLHLVSMGNEMVGVVHPCKVYGALAVGRPVLLLGPARSHIGEIIERHGVGYRVNHGDVAGAVAAIRDARAAGPEVLSAMGARGLRAVRELYGREVLLERLCDLIAAELPAAIPGSP